MTGAPNPAALARALGDRATPSSADGVAAVEEILAGMAVLDTMSSAERVPVFEAAHERLQDVLAAVDDA
ncbi:hypothetical protein Afil01_41310 [Actinorhabdospora filicis]|uniref:Uncharacterized protein n=1 Tax=Actinorhabdospora filicis TaxID=1785913 RepID=A0A9W6WA61_9ACTN|nr:hypothetical protein [Actinorhabdospora filicis]GLZ79324.1 hypothetical protein Afil01_41310 [Actinorhabdospora filicis]